jgi:hypothetical protein
MIHRIIEPDTNERIEPFLPDVDPTGSRFVTLKRDFVEPVPVGSYVAMVFRVVGYSPDCDGSALAEVEQVNRHGETTGWGANSLGLWEDTDVRLDGPGDLHDLIR